MSRYAVNKKNGLDRFWSSPLVFAGILVRPERFERPTPWFVAKYSIQLSYGRTAFLKLRII